MKARCNLGWPKDLDVRAAADMRQWVKRATAYEASPLGRAKQTVKAQRQTIEELEQKVSRLKRLKEPPWRRECWVCGSPASCGHREPELVDLWRVSGEVKA